MKGIVQFVVVVSLLVSFGCVSPEGRERVTVSAVVLDSERLALVGFTNMGYSDESILVEVASPASMKGIKIAIVLWDRWGRELRTYAEKDEWSCSDGETIAFSFRMKDLASEDGNGIRRLNGNRVRREEEKQPNQALQTTSVTRSGFGKVPVSDRQRRGV